MEDQATNQRPKKAVERVLAQFEVPARQEALGRAAQRAMATVAQLREARRIDPEAMNRPVAR